jgi:hypothetical protein
MNGPIRPERPQTPPELLQPVHFDMEKQNPQEQSPLFQKLPAEVRAIVFRYTLSEYEGQLYPNNTPYRRPGQRGRYRVETALLRTCRRVYYEAWFFPFTTADHTFYLTVDDRRPTRRISDRAMQSALRIYEARHGYTELDSVTVIAQLWVLEPGGMLQSMFDWKHFHPRCVTVVIRHSDWWLWENDEPIHIAPQFANESRFPASVREIRLELESTMRRKEQIKEIAGGMRRQWSFKRKDGVSLTAVQRPRFTFSWTGDYTWVKEREFFPSDQPTDSELLDYFVEVVRFRSARLDAEDQQAAMPNNPNLDVRLRQEIALTGDNSTEPEVIHRNIGRIDGDRVE